ncbi:hypothetical protein K461DRAFT_66457 [Myriangium duriaei CBS 260.36]|uniref:Uncharacterized protein n=1 Tax=Myriangium duriaei CBS 260.36 TaxID=1168546 RepID=A0A9P4IRA5_9PEZI|nr:hypothetical protein K461DRAFT_66457 [Myriangium duriaei CBS 260.36]
MKVTLAAILVAGLSAGVNAGFSSSQSRLDQTNTAGPASNGPLSQAGSKSGDLNASNQQRAEGGMNNGGNFFAGPQTIGPTINYGSGAMNVGTNQGPNVNTSGGQTSNSADLSGANTSSKGPTNQQSAQSKVDAKGNQKSDNKASTDVTIPPPIPARRSLLSRGLGDFRVRPEPLQPRNAEANADAEAEPEAEPETEPEAEAEADAE